jgi:hypothetical protein
LDAVLDDVQTAVEQSGLPVSFNAGLSTADVKRLGERLPFPLPSEVVAVFKWKNGCSGTLSLIPEFQFMSLAGVVIWVEGNARLFPNGWLPMFTNGGGDFLYLDATSKAKHVLLWLASEQKPGVLAFDSVLTLFQPIAEAYRENLFRVRDVSTSICKADGSYETVTRQIIEAKDVQTWRAIKQKLNPISAKAGAYGQRPAQRTATVPEVIPIHIEELQRYGTLQTELPAKERRKEMEEVDYLIQTMARQLKTMKAVAPPQNYQHVRNGLENLKKLQKALKSFRM